MKPPIYLLFSFLTFLHPLDATGQSIYEREIQSYLSKVASDKALQIQFDFVISDIVEDQNAGLTHVYVQHTVEALPIIGNISGFHFNSASKLEYTGLRLPNSNSIQRKNSKKVNLAKDALRITANILGLNPAFKLEKDSKVITKSNTYIVPELSTQNIFLREALWDNDDELIPIWEVGIYDDKSQKWQVLRLDKSSGLELNRDSWTEECFIHPSKESHNTECETLPMRILETNAISCDSSYNVFAYPLSAPNEGIQSIVKAPWNLALNASPDGWHDTTFLRGNNALAVEDINADDSGGYSVDGGANLCFELLYRDSLSPIDNLDVSLTNAFYWNNLIHDVMYNYGFDEEAGNFQQSNFNRGGAEFDRVYIDILDGSGQNNANFSTPPDGFAARMQMFEWIPSIGNILKINEPHSIGRNYNMFPALFGPTNITLTDTIVVSNPSNACDSILNGNALLGKIALLDRGDCSFVEKALEVQNAGAIAMIVCNNNLSDIFRMGGENSNVVIPSIMISKTQCDSLKIQLDTVLLEATITIPATFDSGLDNGIVTHEYAHGISIRLTGGPSAASCLTGNEQMGEGWSDWYALMFSLDSLDLPETPIGIGTYVLGQDTDGSGIRNFPYSTDLLVNPVTYNYIKVFSIPHGVGSVWASMLWDMTWNLIEHHGFEADIYNGNGGNNIALELVTLGLKLQPCDPGFIDGRDAILAADEILYNGANACLIWKAFSRRGLGANANQGSSASSTDGTENYDLPTLCAQPIFYSMSSAGMAYSNDTLPLYFDIRTNESSIDSAIVCGFLSNQTKYYSGDFFTLNNDTITFKETEIDSNTFIRNSIEVIVSPNDSSEIYYLEKVENISLNWQIESDTGSQAWEISDSKPFKDSLSFFCKNVGSNQTQLLISPEFRIEGPTILGFWHYFNLEKNWDGGFIELSKDNGNTWIDLGVDALSNGYNENLEQSSNPFSGGRLAYSGTNQEYQQTMIDLSPYSGESIQIRFVLASDDYAFEDGWYVDNISLYHKYEIDVRSKLSADNASVRYDTASIIILPSCEPCTKDLCDSIVISIKMIDKDIYKALQYIESDAVLMSTDDIKFIAGDSILLKPNFSVPEEAIFQAIIDNCIEP
ncbi:MAG: extracellular elastinolytic metalloproteinase [Saprospiraceae bacterium]|jgi:extracellular elastinolytic metalloproteinase